MLWEDFPTIDFLKLAYFRTNYDPATKPRDKIEYLYRGKLEYAKIELHITGPITEIRLKKKIILEESILGKSIVCSPIISSREENVVLNH